MLPDPVGERRGFLRVVDETGDDCMFPSRCFVPVTQPGKRGRFIRCVRNEGHKVSLELHRWYEMLPDPAWESRGFIRVIDESGEDYVYHPRYFAIADPVERDEGNAISRDS